jgi:phosphohistidine phosphatase
VQRLYLMRHGEALSTAQWGGLETERPLTEVGRRDLRQVAAGIAALDIRFDLVASSSYARAVETAEIVALVLGHKDPIETSDRFIPGATTDAVLGFIQRFAKKEHVLLVGHAPDVGKIALDLIGWRAKREFFFPTGSICCIDLVGAPPEPYGQLAWFLPAALLATIGKRVP